MEMNLDFDTPLSNLKRVKSLNKIKLINSQRFHIYWLVPIILLNIYYYFMPLEKTFDVIVWEFMKTAPFVAIPIIWLIYLATYVL